MKDDRLYLIHIGECIERIERYVASGHAAFQENTLIQDAVLRNLHTLTESTQRISDSLKAAHPEVEWREIAQFRNVIVHDYLGIDLMRVWDIVKRPQGVPSSKPLGSCACFQLCIYLHTVHARAYVSFNESSNTFRSASR